MFNNLRENFILEQRKIEEIQKEKEREEEEKEKDRQERASKMSSAKQQMLENLDRSKPIEEWPDCEEKY